MKSKKPRGSVILAGTACALVAILFALQNPWFESTWDLFHGDIVATALLFDLMFPLAFDPYLSLMLPLYLSCLAADLLILHLADGSRRSRRQ